MDIGDAIDDICKVISENNCMGDENRDVSYDCCSVMSSNNNEVIQQRNAPPYFLVYLYYNIKKFILGNSKLLT